MPTLVLANENYTEVCCRCSSKHKNCSKFLVLDGNTDFYFLAQAIWLKKIKISTIFFSNFSQLIYISSLISVFVFNANDCFLESHNFY